MSTNKNAQFTPGPWYAANMGNDFQGLVVEEQTGKNIAVAYDKRDVHILAAAPTMYADLCAVRDYLFELYDEGNAKAGEYAASLGITIEQAEGRHHE